MLRLRSKDLKLILLLLLLLQLIRSNSSQKIQPRIVGGTKTTQAALGGYVLNLRYDGAFYCGGSLVTTFYVVTAAHCVSGYQASRMTVQGGVSKLTQTGVIRNVSKYFVPATYNSQRLNMDIAVIRLQSAMTGSNIKTISLCNVDWRAGDWMRVSGWGITRYGNTNASTQLRTVKLRLIKKTTCQKLYRYRDVLYASTFCATARGKDSCSGDSGGGVIYNKQLCGVVSWGEGCANPNYPGVYTSIHKTRSFILKSMNS